MAANDRQVAGNHYKSNPIQHWDYVLANGIPYLEAQVIKYVTRWRKKNGVEDLQKAQHYLEKLIEEAVHEAAVNPPRPQPVRPERVRAWVGFAFEGDKEGDTMYQCQRCSAHILAPIGTDPILVHGDCAGGDYVAG